MKFWEEILKGISDRILDTENNSWKNPFDGFRKEFQKNFNTKSEKEFMEEFCIEFREISEKNPNKLVSLALSKSLKKISPLKELLRLHVFFLYSSEYPGFQFLPGFLHQIH